MENWNELLKPTTEQPFFSALQDRVAEARRSTRIYPPTGQEYRALELCPPNSLRVVILGQDPYHEPGQAMGLSFSVPEGTKLPPSLRNIYTELESDLGHPSQTRGDLSIWAQQGVLLLNTVLTVEEGRANSHSTWGWQRYTDAVIEATNRLSQPVAFVLWGAQAQKKAALIRTDAPRLLLQSPHPSPLSSYRGFFGSKPFSRINDFLTAHGQTPIDW